MRKLLSMGTHPAQARRGPHRARQFSGPRPPATGVCNVRLGDGGGTAGGVARAFGRRSNALSVAISLRPNVLQVPEEAGVCRPPSEGFLSVGAGSRLVHCEDWPNGPKVSSGTASTGRSSRRPMTAAISRSVSPSSATAC